LEPKLGELSTARDEFAAEWSIRDAYAARLAEFRPNERVWRTEHIYYPSLLRGDLRTVDTANRVRIWEFKIKAGYDGLGQILTYVALARKETDFSRPVLGVLAAFEFALELATAIEVLNLGIELVTLPEPLRLAGQVPATVSPVVIPNIPHTHAASASPEDSHE
jgi:hypothetical protein